MNKTLISFYYKFEKSLFKQPISELPVEDKGSIQPLVPLPYKTRVHRTLDLWFVFFLAPLLVTLVCIIRSRTPRD